MNKFGFGGFDLTLISIKIQIYKFSCKHRKTSKETLLKCENIEYQTKKDVAENY